MIGDIRQEQALSILFRLQKSLDLSREDVGTMLGVTGDIVRAWDERRTEVPEAALGKLRAADASLRQLLEIFLPERLPQVIRRRADAFNGERAIAWIMDGRIAEVADTYDRGLAYLKRPA